MNNIMIWVADWEMQCCGTPFKNNDCIKWTISERKNDFSKIDEKHNIDYYYDAHGISNKLYEISGVVSKIQIVYALYELVKGKQKYYTPISYKLADFYGEADGWEKDLDEYKFCAYLVQLDCENTFEGINLKRINYE